MQQDRRSKLVDSRSMISVLGTDYPKPKNASRAGADLRNARERLDWPLAAVAEWLRIRPAYLSALEDGRLDLLPGNAYAMTYLRTYARALGLDPEEMVRRFKNEAQEVTRPTELTFPVPVPERGLPAGAWLFLGVLLLVAVYAGWYRLSGEGKLPAESLAIPERLAPLAQQALPPIPPAAAPATQVTASEPAGGGTEFADRRPEPGPAFYPPATAVSPASAAAAPVSSIAPPAPPAPALAAPDATRISVRVSADAWVQVRDKSGQILLNRTLHPGETWAVPNRPGLLLTTGNAGGTELLVDGVPTAPLGGSGVVRRDLVLDPDALKDGRLAAPTVSQISVRSSSQ